MSAIPRPFTILSSGGSIAGPTNQTSTDNAIVRWDGTNGRVVQNSVLIVADTTGALSGFTTGAGITLHGGGTITGASGSLDLAASGTNQSITLTPSGTGFNSLVNGSVVGGGGTLTGATGLTLAYVSGSNRGEIIARAGATLKNLYFNSNTGGYLFDVASTRAFLIASGLTTSDNPVLLSNTSTLRFGATANATIGVSADTTAGVVTFTAPSSGTYSFDKTVSSYNGIATAGNGVASVQGAGRATAQIAANASISTYTVGASDASFLVSVNVLVTVSTNHNFTITCTYTDEGSTSRTVTVAFTQLTASTFLTAITNITGAGPYESFPLHIRCKASTAITIASTGTFTTVTYNAEGAIVKLA